SPTGTDSPLTMFSQKELNLEEHQLRERIHALSAEERARYDALEIPRLRQASTYLLLNILFPFAIYHMYVGRWEPALHSLTLTTAAILRAIGRAPWDSEPNPLLAFMLMLAMVLIAVPEMTNARVLVQSRNNRAMGQCLDQCRKHSS